jgi:hypothetical protein
MKLKKKRKHGVRIHRIVDSFVQSNFNSGTLQKKLLHPGLFRGTPPIAKKKGNGVLLS